MPRTSIKTISAPLGGKFARSGYQTQPPYTLLDCRDMWPVEASTGRAMLAVRPGFSAYQSKINVNMIGTLSVAADSGSQEDHKRQLIIARNGNLYHIKNDGTFDAGQSAGLDTNRNIQCTSYYTVLYIANYITDHYVKYTYDSPDGVISDWTAATAGTLPARCTLITTWNARIVLAGDPQNPHTVYFSRVDDPEDWDYTATDTGAAVSVPDIMEPVTALIPHANGCLVVGTYDSLWIFKGDPADSGFLEKFENIVGPICGTAWCKDPLDNTYMLTRDGLYFIPAGCGVAPRSLSREKIPASLLGLNGVDDLAYLEYDSRFRMIHIYIQGDHTQGFHYFPETESFWPVTLPGTSILAMARYNPIETSTLSGVLVGTAENLVSLSSSAYIGGSDEAYAAIGPVKISGSIGTNAKVSDATFALSSATNDTTGTIRFFGGIDAFDASAYPDRRTCVYTVQQVLDNRRCMPHLTGNAFVIFYTQGSTSKTFGFEQCDLTLTERGRERAT